MQVVEKEREAPRPGRILRSQIISFLRYGLPIALGNGLVALIGLASLRLYTGMVDARVFGFANLVLGGLALAMQVAVLPISSTQLRFHAEQVKLRTADAFTAQALRLCVCSASILVVLTYAGSLISRAIGGPTVNAFLLAAIAWWLLASPVRNVLFNRLHAERRMQGLTVYRVAEATMIASAIGLGLLVSPTAETFIWGQALAISVVVTAAAFFNRSGFKIPSRTVRAEFNRRLWNYGLAFAPMSLLVWTGNLADRYVLEGISGAASVGAYVAAFGIASSGFILSNTLMADLFRARLFQAQTSSDHKAAVRTFHAWLMGFAGISAIGLLIIGLFGRTIAHLVLAPEYRAGAPQIMLWIAVGYSISGLTAILENRIFSFAQSRRVLAPQLAGALSAIALSIPFVTWRGAVGAAQASCVSFAIQCCVTLFLFVPGDYLVMPRRDAQRDL